MDGHSSGAAAFLIRGGAIRRWAVGKVRATAEPESDALAKQ